MSDQFLKAGAAGCCCVLLIVSISLLLASFSSLEPTEIGLDYNGNTKMIDETKAYTEGRVLLGLGHSFIIFPRVIQTLTLSRLPSRTKDGLSVILDGEVQWKMEQSPASLHRTYRLFELDYAAVYEKVAKDKVRNVIARFSAFQLYFNRSAVGSSMGTEMETALRPLGAIVESFQLLNFELPHAFEEAIATTEATKQLIEQAETEQQTARKRVNSRKQVAIQDAESIRVTAQAEADVFVLNRRAESGALAATYEAERDAYGDLAARLDFTPSLLLSYIWLQSVAESGARQVVGLDVPPEFQVGMQ
jgi:hypothetical protein